MQNRTSFQQSPHSFIHPYALLGLFLLTLAGLLFFFTRGSQAASQRQSLTLAERVTAQRAIEEVYWRHRIWPKENPQPKPLLDEVMPESALHAKVEDYLRLSNALEQYWQRPVTGEQLQAKMARMARETQQPKVLSELWAALGNGPLVIAECLARPALVERRLRRASADWKIPNASVFANRLLEIETVSARYANRSSVPTDPTDIVPIPRAFHTAVWTGIEMIVWGGVFPHTNTGGRYNPATDTWATTSTTNAPSARYLHTTVWTGSEMIVWGGYSPFSGFDTNTGGRYNPVTNTWTATKGCGYSFTPTSQTIAGNGGTSSVNITTGIGCSWTATTNANWITITSGSSGVGNGTVNYSVAANTNPNSRRGFLSIAGQDYFFTQSAGSACHTVSALNPTSGVAGNPVTLTGTGFTGVNAVRFANNQTATFTVNSDTQITATIPANAVSGPLTLSKPNCNDVQTASFTINQPPNPTPVLTQLTPNSVNAGSAGFTLMLSGSNFLPASQVKWNNADRLTSFINSTQLTINVPASDVATPGTASVTVTNPASSGGGGGTSQTLSFTITQPQNPVPTLTSLNPSAALAGSPALLLTVNGANFVNGSVVRWNGNNRTTTFVSGTQLTAAIPATDLAMAGTARLTVFTPAPGGGLSNELPFTINQAVACLSAASFLGAELAPDSIVAAFGASLATTTLAAATAQLPTTLAGTTVRIRDSAGTERLAPLFFVSPQQLNFLLPPGTAAGAATITVTSSDGTLSLGRLQIAAVVPGLFTANANGQGVPAAVALRVKADGTQSFELVAQFDAAQGRFVPLPLDLGSADEQVILLLFGTGLRGRSALAAVTCTIGGASTPVSFAGAQGDLVGLDQINLGPLPRTLAGRGEVDLVLTVEGKAANAVRISFR